MNAAPERRSLLAWQLALASTLLLTWEWGAAEGHLDPFFFSRPSEVLLRIGQWGGTGTLWIHLWTTFVEAALSCASGGLLGILAGFLLAWAPRVVLAPIFLLWFGLGVWSKVALGVTVVFFIVFFNTSRGVDEADPAMIDNARMLGASDAQLFRHVLVPSALTWIFSSLHISIGMAIVAVVVGEYLGASRGIGYLIAQAEGVFDATGVFAGMTILAVGVLIVGDLISRLERRLLRWKPRPARSERASMV